MATLISKVTLEYVQRFGDKLFAEVERWGARITEQAKEKLQPFYPATGGQMPVAYISFRRIQCEGPKCGADVVLTSKFHLSRRGAVYRLAPWWLRSCFGSTNPLGRSSVVVQCSQRLICFLARCALI